MARLNQRFPRYSKLLYFYPAGYRHQYGEQMLQTLADMLDDPERSRTAVWSRLVFDFPFSVLRQQLSYTGEAVTNTTPAYIKRTATLSAWLVAPFFVFIVLNSFMNDRLQHSWVWHTNALFIWLVVLPAVAALLSLAAFLRWVQHRRKDTKASAWKVLSEVRYSWPAVTMTLVGVGILALVFFHDSAHCVTGNPIRELHNPHQTLQCIQRG